MNNLFDAGDCNGILDRLSNLEPGCQRGWGKMSAAQMLAHCQMPLKVALGEGNLKRNLVGALFGGMAKRALMKDQPFKKSLPTAPGFVIKDERDFAIEKKRLEELIRKFNTTDPSTIVARKHPFFGSMTEDEWGALQWKHLDHHLRQFGM